MPSPSLKFSKKEKLKSKKVIQQLFKARQSIHFFPLRVIWGRITPRFNDYPAQFGVTVPKKNFSKAVDRNRIKRQIREVYRLDKSILYEELSLFGEQYGLMFIYTGKKKPTFKALQKSLSNIKKALIKQLEKKKR